MNNKEALLVTASSVLNLCVTVVLFFFISAKLTTAPVDVEKQVVEVQRMVIQLMDDRFRRADHTTFVSELLSENPDIELPGYTEKGKRKDWK